MAKYDVVKDYDWTSIPRGSGLRKKAPRVWIRSYRLKSNGILKRFENYLKVLSVEDADSFYDRLYGESSKVEDDFNFPFFNDSVRSFTNTFGDTFQNGVGGGGGIGTAADASAQAIVGNLAQIAAAGGTDVINEAAAIYSSGASKDDKIKGIGNALATGVKNVFTGGGDPGSYIETPKFYQYEQNDAPLQVSFVLSNTLNDDYDKNHKLIQKLQGINRPFRKNSIAMEPARIFQVRVPGQRFIKWAYCSSFDISLLGTKREIGGVIVPEAYQISMSFTSLTVEVSNFILKS